MRVVGSDVIEARVHQCRRKGAEKAEHGKYCNQRFHGDSDGWF
jgi:hypothetical protein